MCFAHLPSLLALSVSQLAIFVWCSSPRTEYLSSFPLQIMKEVFGLCLVMFSNVTTQKRCSKNEDIMWHFAISDYNVARHVLWCVASFTGLLSAGTLLV